MNTEKVTLLCKARRQLLASWLCAGNRMGVHHFNLTGRCYHIIALNRITKLKFVVLHRDIPPRAGRVLLNVFELTKLLQLADLSEGT